MVTVIRGTPGDDTLEGTPGPDLIRGFAGNDLIFGRGGDDELHGGLGDDEIYGNRGHDVIYGGVGNDILHGNRGADQLFGGPGDDELFGGLGPDRLHGGPGNDRLFGGRGDDWLFGGPGQNTLSGGPGADRFVFRLLGQPVDVITDFSPEQGDHLHFQGALHGAAVRMIDQGTDTLVRVKPASADEFTDLVLLEDYRQPIDVWHGDQQQFGDPGEAQRWVNILGNVSTQGLTSLSYALNGGPQQGLGIGPNGSRLEAQGDFNVEIAYDQLDPSQTDDIVTIRAAYGDGQVFTRDVTVEYQGGKEWPTDYSIDWANVTNLQEVVQVVDGHWSFDADGARPASIGYDRLLVLGETTWDSYEVRLSFTPHDLSGVPGGGAIWLGMQWGGHTTDPFGGQPLGGYIPGATFMLNGAIVLRPSEFEAGRIPENPQPATGFPLVEGQTYNILIRNERAADDTDLSDGLDRTYSIKGWAAGSPEPEGWALSQTMVDQEPFGSFYLNAHYVDVTFGDISFTPLPGDEVLMSQDGLPELLAAGVEDAPATRADGPGQTAAPALNLSDLLVGGSEAEALV